MRDQMQFADATGDAVIISAGADGEVVFTRKPQGDGYLVSTNFNVANRSNFHQKEIASRCSARRGLVWWLPAWQRCSSSRSNSERDMGITDAPFAV